MKRSATVLLTTLVAAWCLSTSAFARQEAEFVPPPLDRYEELIGVLMTPDEASVWASLLSAGPRQAFLDSFWQVRDPTPGTEANEVRDIFMLRARRADSLYSEGDVPGYATDRGRVLIVYGLPDEQEYRAVLSTAGGPGVIWRFEELSDPIQFGQQGDAFVLSAPVKLDNAAFVRSAESELRLPLAAPVGARRQPGFAVREVEPGEGDAPVPDPTVEVAPEVRIWMQMVFAGARREDFSLGHRVDFFPAAEGTYTVLEFEVDPDALGYAVAPVLTPSLDDEDSESLPKPVDPAAAAVAAAREYGVLGLRVSPFAARCTKQRLVEEGLLPVDALPQQSALTEFADDPDRRRPVERVPAAPLKLFGAILQGEPGRENTIHQFIAPFCVPAAGVEVAAGLAGRDPLVPLAGLFRSAAVTLVPGTYRLAWGVYDEVTGLAATRDETLEVPDFSVEQLQLSSIVIARPPHRDSPEVVRTDRVYPGIRLGGVLLADDIEREVDRNEVLEIVVIVTGWQNDPSTPGKPRLQVGYRLLVDEDDSVARIPAQILDFHVLGQQLPLRQVNDLQPGATYLLEVRVTDLVTGAQTRRTVPIKVAATVAEEFAEPR